MIEVGRLHVYGIGYFLGGHNHKSENLPHKQRFLRAAIVDLAGPHNPQYPCG